MSGRPPRMAAHFGSETANRCKIVDRATCALTVFIESPEQPAALLGTMVLPSGKHRKNCVAPPCAPSVLCEGRPLAGVGDKVLCCSGQDTIVTGALTVFVGDGEG